MKRKDRERLAKRVGVIAEKLFMKITESETEKNGLSFEISDFGKRCALRISDVKTCERKRLIECFAIPSSEVKDVELFLTEIEKEL